MSALALSMGAKALVLDQPNALYHSIVDRNAFGLKPPPDPKTLTPPVPVDPLPKITLTGLRANTVYHYRLILKDPVGNTTMTGDYTFK